MSQHFNDQFQAWLNETIAILPPCPHCGRVDTWTLRTGPAPVVNTSILEPRPQDKALQMTNMGAMAVVDCATCHHLVLVRLSSEQVKIYSDIVRNRNIR